MKNIPTISQLIEILTKAKEKNPELETLSFHTIPEGDNDFVHEAETLNDIILIIGETEISVYLQK